MISFDAKNKELFEKHIHKLANSMFSAVADQSSQVQKVLWRSVIGNIISQFQGEIWQQIDLKKGVLPQLHTCLKNAGFGAHTELYKNFVAFSSLFPLFSFEDPFETSFKIEQPKGKSKQMAEETKSDSNTAEQQEDEKEEQSKKGKKKAKKTKDKPAEVVQEKFIKNSFSITEKVNVMYDLMKSLFSGIEIEEAIAFDEEIVQSYYDTICYLYIKKILPAIDSLSSKKDEKNLKTITQKSTQWFMLPVSEFLKKNNPKLNRSTYSSIPEKFTKALVLLADKGIDPSQIENLFSDFKETLMIGIERAPQNTIKLLSVIIKTIPANNGFFNKIQEIGRFVIQTLYTMLVDGVQNLNKDTIEKFEKDVEVFSYISYAILSMNVSSDIFDISDKERKDGVAQPHEFTILVNILKTVKIVWEKLKPEVLQSLELIEEKFWLCLIMRVNYLWKRNSTEVQNFMENQMLDLIFENIKNYGVDTDRYLRFIIQYISPSDCLQLLISENIEKRPDPRKFKKKVLEERNKEIEQLFAPYENTIMASQKIQDNWMKVFFIDMLDEYSKSHQILTIYSIFQRKIDDYVQFKLRHSDHTMFWDDSIKSFLESALEFLDETDHAHKSLQLAELSGVFNKLILNMNKEDICFDYWVKISKSFFFRLVEMHQNLASALELWKFIYRLIESPTINENNEFLTFVENHLKGRIQKLIMLENYQEQEFNNEILILKNFTSWLPRSKVSVVDSLSRIVLHEENFNRLSENWLVLKLFQQTFLCGGLGFNIDNLAFIKEEATQEYKYIWLLWELLNSYYLPSLAGYTNLRTQIQVFWETEVLPLILRDCCSDSADSMFLAMIRYLNKKSVEKSSLYAKTLGNIIDLIVCEKSELGFTDASNNKFLVEETKSALPEGLYDLVAGFNQWRTMLDLTINSSVDVVLDSEDSNDPEIRRRIEMIKIVSKSTKNLLYSLEWYQEIIKNIISKFDVNKESNVILYSIMIDENKIDSKTINLMEEEKTDPIDHTDQYLELKVMHKILTHVSELLDSKLTDFSMIDSVLESFNSALKRLGIANTLEIFNITYDKLSLFLKNALEFLIIEESPDENNEESKEEIDIQSSSNSITMNSIGINLLKFIKVSIGYLYQYNKSCITPIIDWIFEYSRIKVELFNSKIQNLKLKIKQTHTSSPFLSLSENEYELISFIGDLISNLAPYIHASLDEDILYSLISTHINHIQKSAYVILQHFYQSFVPPVRFKYAEETELNEDEFKEQVERDINNEESKEEVKDDLSQQQKINELKAKRIKGEPDKNVPVTLLEIIEKGPQFIEEANEQDEELSEDEVVEGYMNIESASTLLDDKIMNNDVYSYLLAWNSMLNKIGCAKMKLKLEQDHEYLRVINTLQEFLTMNQHVYEMFLVIIVAYLPSKINQKYNPKSIIDWKPEWVDLNDQASIEEFALYSMYNFMTNFPSLAREYYQAWDKRIYNVVFPIISKLISPAIMENEIRKIEISQADLSTQNLSFVLFKSTKEILANYVQGEVEVQLRLKIPSEYPLKSVDVKCTKQLKIPENQLRRWMLSIRKTISSQNGDFISGILLWKSNIEKEIEGVEDCLICYSTVHVIDKSLPKLACKNCKNKFHAHCIKKWFAESQKSKCPMCQSYFW